MGNLRCADTLSGVGELGSEGAGPLVMLPMDVSTTTTSTSTGPITTTTTRTSTANIVRRNQIQSPLFAGFSGSTDESSSIFSDTGAQSSEEARHRLRLGFLSLLLRGLNNSEPPLTFSLVDSSQTTDAGRNPFMTEPPARFTESRPAPPDPFSDLSFPSLMHAPPYPSQHLSDLTRTHQQPERQSEITRVHRQQLLIREREEREREERTSLARRIPIMSTSDGATGMEVSVWPDSPIPQRLMNRREINRVETNVRPSETAEASTNTPPESLSPNGTNSVPAPNRSLTEPELTRQRPNTFGAPLSRTANVSSQMNNSENNAPIILGRNPRDAVILTFEDEEMEPLMGSAPPPASTQERPHSFHSPSTFSNTTGNLLPAIVHTSPLSDSGYVRSRTLMGNGTTTGWPERPPITTEFMPSESLSINAIHEEMERIHGELFQTTDTPHIHRRLRERYAQLANEFRQRLQQQGQQPQQDWAANEEVPPNALARLAYYRNTQIRNRYAPQSEPGPLR